MNPPDVYLCNAPGTKVVKGRRVCGNEDAYPKFTASIHKIRSGDRSTWQPQWRCEEHWKHEKEVDPWTGDPKKGRRFPGGGD